MSGEKTTLEIIAPTIEEAVQKGLEQLNLPAEAVDVEVLDAGSKGLFGLGSRQARVRLSIKPEDYTPGSINEEVVSTPPVRVAEKTKPPKREPEPVIQQIDLTPEETEAVGVTRQVVSDLLEKMKINANVQVSIRRALDAEDEDNIVVNIEGEDLSILIGRRTETLNALQYITSLIVGKQINRWTPLMIDVQGYRARRERQLQVLARRMADQAIHSGRKQVLEPMPANERRIIHLELRDHPQVDTESVGDDPNRKITIFPKR